MTPTIAAVVPNYNYAAYVPQRLASIRAQTRPADVLVFLDDASADDSMNVATPLLADWPGRVEIHQNERNSGFVLGQWKLGLDRAGTDFVWIAEADDSADPRLLSSLAAELEADPETIFAFCDSAAIGPDGTRTASDSKDYVTAFDPGLAQDGTFGAEEFLARFLCPRNSVVCSSAVLWRASALKAAFDSLGSEAQKWLCAGDWRLYAEACTLGGRVRYLAAPLNEHRRHGGSVTGATPRPRHFAEIIAMLSWLRQRLGRDEAQEARMRQHLAMLRQAWRLDTVA